MVDTTLQGALLTLSLERDRPGAPLYVQLYQQLRDLILRGALTPALRLPATRTLSRMLGLSRTTAIAAYEQLESEGYIEQRRGAGTFICTLPPDSMLTVQLAPGAPPPGADRQSRTDPAVIALAITAASNRTTVTEPVPFAPHIADRTLFPYRQWGRLLGRSWRHPDAGLLSEHDQFGHIALRDAIGEHLKLWRGISCDPAQIVVTSGAGEAIDLLARALMPRGSAIWFEDPGYRSIQAAADANGLEVIPVPVDEAGLDIEAGIRIRDDARAVVVTPSRQYPLGVTLSAPRRMALQGWAQRAGAWIIEDDYDSEYRYAGRPLAPLMSLDSQDQVIYMGSFSKVLLSSFRLGYLVVPPGAIDPMRACLAEFGTRASLIAQPALAEFMATGGYGAYIRKTRRIYARRQSALFRSVEHHLAGLLDAPEQSAGLHVVAWLSNEMKRHCDDVLLSRHAEAAGIHAAPLSPYYRAATPRQGLLLGFAGFSEQRLEASARRLGEVAKTLIG